MTRSVTRSTLAELALAVTLASCATRAPDPPPERGAPAVARWSWSRRGGEFVGDPESIGAWTLHVDVPGDDLEFDLTIDSDAKLVEGGRIGPSADLRFARSSESRGEDHPILFFPPEPSEPFTPRLLDSIDNPAMSSFWVAPRVPVAAEPVAVEPDAIEWETAEEIECLPPDPPNCDVPRAVVDRLRTLRGTSNGNVVTLAFDDVVMEWAMPFLRSELAASKVP